VFTRTKHGANRLAEQLDKDGISAVAIHGNKSQGARTRALAEFKQGVVRVLVATDIAARGLDIDQLPHVVNFELPNVPEDYVHRIGRTGRAGNEGQALSLVCVDETQLLRDIERVLNREIPRMQIPGYEPNPTIKAEPIPNGRGQRAGGTRQPARSGGGARPPARSGGGARSSAAGARSPARSGGADRSRGPRPASHARPTEGQRPRGPSSSSNRPEADGNRRPAEDRDGNVRPHSAPSQPGRPAAPARPSTPRREGPARRGREVPALLGGGKLKD
jgi:ATP-dependent RNA helicase RhlE